MPLARIPFGLEKMIGNVTVLPEDAQCPVCHLWDITVPEVIAAMEVAGKPLNLAACKCAEDAEAVEQARRHRYHDANLPHEREGRQRSLKNFDAREGTAEARNAIMVFSREEGPQMLTLTGRTGTGKSHLLEAAGRAYLGRGRRVRYEYVPLLTEQLRAANSPTAELDFHAVMERYRGFHLLILDDLGERTSQFSTEALTSLVEDRVMNGGRLLVATNLVQDDVAHYYGHRLMSRLWDRSDEDRTAVVTLTATDRRVE